MEHGHWARHCPNNSKTDGSPSAKTYGPCPAHNGPAEQSGDSKNHRTPASRPSDFRPTFLAQVKCYNCNEKGHLALNCPQEALFCSLMPAQANRQQQDHVCHHGTINGIYSQDIVVNTGTLVHSYSVTPDDLVKGEITISCAHGGSVSYPLATVKISNASCLLRIILQPAFIDRTVYLLSCGINFCIGLPQ